MTQSTAYESFEILPGSPESAVILHVPHSSTTIPGWVRERIRLDDAALSAELAALTDARTDVIAARAAALVGPAPDQALRPWQFVNRLSRLVIDPERFPDDREELNTVGMGAVYTRTSAGLPLRDVDADHAERLLQTYFHPYAEAFTALVDERLQALGRAVIIDVHSYPPTPLPYELHAELGRPEICLGHDEAHTPVALLETARRCFGGADRTAVNEPFIGTYVPLKHYRSDTRVESIMIEIRRDTHTDDAGLERIAASLARLVTDIRHD